MSIASVNPATGETLISFEPHTAGEIDGILTAAAIAQSAWARTTLEQRAVPMRRAAAL